MVLWVLRIDCQQGFYPLCIDTLTSLNLLTFRVLSTLCATIVFGCPWEVGSSTFRVFKFHAFRGLPGSPGAFMVHGLSKIGAL